MAPSRRRGPIASRRRLGDGDEEEEDDDTLADDGDDSHSETSVGSDGEGEEEEGGDHQAVGHPHSKAPDATSVDGAAATPAFLSTSDTAAMATGIEPPVQENDTASVDFEDLEDGGELTYTPSTAPTGQKVQSNGKLSQLAERRRENGNDNKKNGDVGTASKGPLAPSRRGGYFMHDQRSVPGGHGFGPFGRGRGRGKGFPGGSVGGFNAAGDTSDTINGTWAHDLHDTVNDTKPILEHQPHNLIHNNFPNQVPIPRGPSNAVAMAGLAPRANPFSRTTQTGRVQLRVFMQGMNEPKVFSGVAVKHHTRLPDLRPPLRRDKPVRVSIPDQPPRYQFPKVERSFIFIPRAERPNQQNSRRGRTKGMFSQQGSGRASVQGGSTYTGSVNHSRRSSRAQSPAGSVSSRPILGPMVMGPPIVRLPFVQAGPANTGMMMPPPPPPPGTDIGTATDVTTGPTPSSYPLPQAPEYREARAGNLTIHQPRPQKTVSVAGIESPTSLAYPTAPQQLEQQPFHQQMPTHIGSRSGSQDPAAVPMYFQHSRQLSYPSQGSGSTPLSHIPDRAIHAQPFQPGGAPGMFPPQAYGPAMYPMQNMYYYGPNTTAAQPSMYGTGPLFIPSTPYGMGMDAAAAHGSRGVNDDSGRTGQGVIMMAPPPPPQLAGTLGHDGTTYFFDPSQHSSSGLAGASASGVGGEPDGLAPVSYAVPGMGGMMTPSPDGYFYAQSQGNATTAAAAAAAGAGMGYYVPQEFVPSQ